MPSRGKAVAGRSPRTNVTAAYPFADSVFNAAEVISGEAEAPPPGSPLAGPAAVSAAVSAAPPAGESAAPSFASLAPAVRRRLSARAFADWAQGSASVRVADVPAALGALGLGVGAGLPEAMLAHARLAAAAEKALGAPAVEPKLRLQEWQALVERYVDDGKARKVAAHKEAVAQRVRMKLDGLAANAAAAAAVQGVAADGSTSEGAALVEALLTIGGVDGTSALDEADAHLTSASAAARCEAYGANDDTEGEWEGGVDQAAEDAVYRALGRGIVEARNRLQLMSPAEKRAAGAGKFDSRVRSAGSRAGITGATTKRWDASLSSAVLPPHKAASRSATASSMRTVQSKISSQVRRDRMQFRRHQGATKDAALKTVARDKVDVLVNGRGRRQTGASVTGPDGIDLTSGSTAMHIAHAFLQGPVGQQLGELEGGASYALAQQPAVGDSDSDDAAAEARFLLSAPLGGLRGAATLSDTELRVAAASEAARQQLIDARAAAVRRGAEEPRELPDEWVASNGGFAADFGAAVTGSKSYRR